MSYMNSEELKGNKVRILVSSYDVSAIDDVVRRIIVQTNNLGLKSSGIVMLPNRKRRISILNSPHKYKTSQSHYEYISHKRLINVYGLTNLQGYQSGLGIIPRSVALRIVVGKSSK